MSYQGSGSSALLFVALVAMMMVVSQSDAAIYTVGDTNGWTFNMDSWSQGKHFRAGDSLVFNYNSGFHNVVPVNKAAYDSCTTPKGARVYKTGKDQIKLAKGQNYFICNSQGHCESGMKIAITAV